MATPSRSVPPGRDAAPDVRAERSAAARYDRAVRNAVAARQRLEQGLKVLGRLVPLALRLSRLVGVFVAVVGVAAVTIAVVLVWLLWPSSLIEAFGLLIIVAFVLAPVAVLWLFHSALAEVVRIPDRLVAVPDLARTHGTELARLVRESQVGRGRMNLASLPADLWRAGRLLLAAHDDLPGYGAALTLVSVPFLLAALAAAGLGLLEIALAPFLLVGAVLSSLI